MRRDELRRRNRLTLGLALVTVGTILFLAILGGAFVIAHYKGVDYKCNVDGPHASAARVGESSGTLEDARFSVWPLGRVCEWQRQDGVGTVVADSNNWPGTAVLAASGLTALAGSALAVRARPLRQSVRRGSSSRE